MSAFEFGKLTWEESAPGARSKTFRQGGKQLRLVEFTKDFIEHDWCEKGHAGIVLEGELEVEFRDRIVRYPEGAAILIDSGDGHKARSATQVVRLFLVEEA